MLPSLVLRWFEELHPLEFIIQVQVVRHLVCLKGCQVPTFQVLDQSYLISCFIKRGYLLSTLDWKEHSMIYLVL